LAPIVTLDEAVHPLGEVRTTVYVPDALTLIWLSVEPVLQRNEPVPAAVNVADGLAQVRRVLEALMLT
jgi:hypothetical protein